LDSYLYYSECLIVFTSVNIYKYIQIIGYICVNKTLV
jgi:hypothetical protein